MRRGNLHSCQLSPPQSLRCSGASGKPHFGNGKRIAHDGITPTRASRRPWGCHSVVSCGESGRALALAVAVLWHSQGNEARRAALAACSAVFTLRTAFMTINLLPRRIGWLEAVGNALLIYLILYGLAALANNTHPWDQWDFLFLVVFASG